MRFLALLLTLSFMLAADAAAQTTRPVGSITVLDGTTANVTDRQAYHIFYVPGGASLDEAELLKWARSRPKNAYILIDQEPITSVSEARAVLLAIEAVRPDLHKSMYGLVDMNSYGVDGVRGAYDALAKPAAQRNAGDLWYSDDRNLVVALRRMQDARERNDAYRPIVEVCDYLQIRIYPENTREQANALWITREIDSLADEAYRVGHGKPLVLLVSGRLGFEVAWPAALIGVVRDASLSNSIGINALWDTGATPKQAADAASALVVRAPKATTAQTTTREVIR